jgi:excisionase family DNA binding protein
VKEETYTVDEAARILRLTPGRIRQMLRAGELEGL